MYKFLKILFLLLTVVGGRLTAQYPTGFPQTMSYKYYNFLGYVRADSAMIISNSRDTNWIPLFPGTEVFWLNAGVDSAFWMWDSFRWKKLTQGATNVASVTNFAFTDGSGFDGTVTNPTTAPTLSLTTQLHLGSVPFIGTAGALRENNPKFFWDSTNVRHGIGMNAPQATLNVYGQSVFENNYSLNGNVFNDRMAQVNDTITSDNATALRFPRALFAQVVTAGSTNFMGATSEIMGVQGQVKLSVNVQTKEAIGVTGRAWGVATNSADRMTGLEGQVTVSGGVQTVTDAAMVEGTLYHQGGTLNAYNLYYLRTRDTNQALAAMTLNIGNAYGLYIHNITAGTTHNYGVFQAGTAPVNVFNAIKNKFPNLATYSSGTKLKVVWNATDSSLEVTSDAGGASGTVTSVATGLGLSGGTITSTGTIILDTSSAVVLSRQRAAATYVPVTTTVAGFALSGNVTLASHTVGNGLTGSAYNGSAAQAWAVDTGRTLIAIATGGALNKIKDSLGAIIATKGVGTVTSVGLTSSDITVGGSSPITSSGTFTLTLPTVNSNVGTFNNITINAKGLATAGSNVTYLTSAVTSVSTGLGLSGGTITSTGTVVLDTSSSVVLSRQRAAATYQPVNTVDTVNVSNVLSFGADSTGVSDATSAFNNAIAASAIGGKMRVYVPHGTYKINITYLVSGGTAANHQGIQLRDGIELFGDGVGKTILTIANNASATTVLNYIFPVVNGQGVSNTRVHDIEISGNKTNQGQYTTNPYTNPAGYFSDTGHRWSTSGAQYKDGTNNRIENVYIHDMQLNGVLVMDNTNFYLGSSILNNNGGSGFGLLRRSTGNIEYVTADGNESDNMRVDSCKIGIINISHSQGSNSGTSSAATNWFAGMYISAGSWNVHCDNLYLFNNSSYGYDNASDSTARGHTLTNSKLYYNGNGGMVFKSPMTIDNNIFKNNGQKLDASHDTKSSYNPGAIVVNHVAYATITNNHAIDTGVGIQIWFLRAWAADATANIYRSNITGNIIQYVADTAHAYNGDNGTNNILNNQIFTSANNYINPATDGKILTLASGVPVWASGSSGVTSVTGTTNRITSSGGTTPAIDISASYVGQSSITTLGTVTTGTLSTGAVIGGVTMTLGSDASNDIYYRNGSGILTRLANGTTGQVLTATTSSAPTWAGASAGAISALTVAAAANTIDNTNYAQNWQWSTLGAGNGLNLTSTSTAAASNTQTLLNLALSGANATSAQTTYALQASNTHSGGSARHVAGYFSAGGSSGTSNIGGWFKAAGATNNYGLVVESGQVGIGTVAPQAGFQFEVAASGGTYAVLTSTNSRQASLSYNYSTTTKWQLMMDFANSGTADFAVFDQVANKTRLYFTTGGIVSLGGTASAVGTSSLNIDGGAYRTTNGGGNVTPKLGVLSGASLTSAGALAHYFDNTNGFVFAASNGSLQEARAAISIVNLTNTAGSETGDLAFYTQSAGTAITEKWRISSLGYLSNTAAVGTSTLTVSGSFSAGYVAKTGTYTATISDYTIECTANTFTVTLPTAVGIAGRIYNVVNSGAGTITIGTTSSQTFVNVVATPTTLTLAAVGNYQVQSNGANWLVL